MPTEPTPDQIKRMANCKRCGGLRHVLSADGVKAEDCPDCLKIIKYEIHLADSGIPPKYREKEFSDYVYQESITYKNIWLYINQIEKVIDKKLCLLLYGRENTGKSLLASCVLKELMKKDYSCSFVTFSEVFSNDESVKQRLSEDYQFCCVDDITDVLNSLVKFTVSELTDEKTNGAIYVILTLPFGSGFQLSWNCFIHVGSIEL